MIPRLEFGHRAEALAAKRQTPAARRRAGEREQWLGRLRRAADRGTACGDAPLPGYVRPSDCIDASELEIVVSPRVAVRQLEDLVKRGLAVGMIDARGRRWYAPVEPTP